MTRPLCRLLAVSMAITAGAAFVTLSTNSALLAAGRYRCCQECYAAEASCKATCDAMTHDYGQDDSLGLCHQECDSNTEIYECFTSCRDCEVTPEEPCYSFAAQHGTKYPSYTTYHDLTWWLTSQGMCPFHP